MRLKTAFRFLKDHHPEIQGVVTADGDGQHAYEDILRVRDELSSHPDSLVMGVRDFSGKDVPKHNRIGNRLSALYFRLGHRGQTRRYPNRIAGDSRRLVPLGRGKPGRSLRIRNEFLASKRSRKLR
jgi:hypothetical protein